MSTALVAVEQAEIEAFRPVRDVVNECVRKHDLPLSEAHRAFLIYTLGRGFADRDQIGVHLAQARSEAEAYRQRCDTLMAYARHHDGCPALCTCPLPSLLHRHTCQCGYAQIEGSARSELVNRIASLSLEAQERYQELRSAFDLIAQELDELRAQIAKLPLAVVREQQGEEARTMVQVNGPAIAAGAVADIARLLEERDAAVQDVKTP